MKRVSPCLYMCANCADGLTTGEADAMLAASVFRLGKCSIADTKAYFAARGIPLRLAAEAPAAAG